MGTRADFYIGKGKDAEWIGSIGWDGYREGIPEIIRFALNEIFYRKAVFDFIESREDGTKPEMGWPWPWDDSSITDCSYWFFDGKVWDENMKVYTPCSEEIPEYDEGREQWIEGKEKIEFPDMASRKNVTFGERSGLLMVTIK